MKQGTFNVGVKARVSKSPHRFDKKGAIERLYIFQCTSQYGQKGFHIVCNLGCSKMLSIQTTSIERCQNLFAQGLDFEDVARRLTGLTPIPWTDWDDRDWGVPPKGWPEFYWGPGTYPVFSFRDVSGFARVMRS